MNIILADLEHSITDAWHAIGHSKEYVSVHCGSIFDVKCDALVSPANSFGFMDGGIDLAISQFFGWHVQDQLQEKIRTKHHGELLVGQADIVSTNHGQIPYVISAPTMRVPMILHSSSVNVYLAIRALLLLVKFGQFEDGTPISNQVNTIAIPGMGTGVGQLPHNIFALQMKQAIEEVIEERGAYPKTWWDAAKRHQRLYSHNVRDLQKKD